MSVDLEVLGHSHYVKYDPDTGRILCSGSIPTSMLKRQGDNVVEGDGHWDIHYVRDGNITDRPPNPATLDGLQLENLPVPCSIAIDGTAHDCTDTSCELSFTQPGTYTILVSAFPYLDATFTVTQA